ncbi:MAG: 3-deoxy-8-phosphooctulonate synthase [Bdellovibrionales bacterium]|nr:3-deoxy-8-phosphooctulonate synthase [Bdellovibrionales bacterium]
MATVAISDDISIGDGKDLVLLAGPCQIESLDHCLLVCEEIKKATRDLPIQFVFKSSYDKANRTSGQAQRGPGLEHGLEILAQVKEQMQVPVVTDVHTAQDVTLVAEVVDIVQIPAFLCRQTDLLIAAGKTGRAINIKKGQFLHPLDMQYCVEKIVSTGNKKSICCERGTCHGYRDLVVDMRSLQLMKGLGVPVVFDATHSVQSMGGAGGSSSGSREFVPMLARAALAAGIDGLFLEVHDNPDQAPSDGPNMLPLSDLQPLVTKLCAIREVL